MPHDNDNEKKTNEIAPSEERTSLDRPEPVVSMSFSQENDIEAIAGDDELFDDFERDYQKRIERSSLLGQLKPRDARIAWRPVVFLFIVCWLASLVHWRARSGLLTVDWLTSEKSQIITGHEFWRLLTSMAVHSDLSHLLSNGVLFFIFGWILRAYIGSLAFPYLAILAGIITQAITLLTYPSGVRLVGASGAIYAMVGLWLTYYLLIEKNQRLFTKVMRSLAFVLVVLMPSTIQKNVSYRAHAIGFLVGCLLAVFTVRWVKKSLEKKLPAT